MEEKLRKAFWAAAQSAARMIPFPDAQAKALLCPEHLADHARTAWADLAEGRITRAVEGVPRVEGFEIRIGAPRGELGKIIMFVRFTATPSPAVVFGAYAGGVAEVLGDDPKLSELSYENRIDLEALWKPVSFRRDAPEKCPECGRIRKRCRCEKSAEEA